MIGTLHKRFVPSSGLVLATVCLAIAVNSANAQLLFSFEPDLEGWGPTGFGGSDLISVAHSTLGATHGSHSMAVERGRAIGDSNPRSWDVNRTVTPTVAPDIYSIFQAVAADPTKYALDFDVTITPESFGSVAASGPLFAISVSANGSPPEGGSNFSQLLDVAPVGASNGNLIGSDGMGGDVPKLGTHHYSIPLTSSLGGTGLYLVPDSTYYQLNIGSTLTNALFQPGPNGEGAVYFVDNIRFRELPATVEHTLFSWETPDNPATPTVNEQFEGWVSGFHEGHAHSIVTTGATHGSSALQIDRTSVESGFRWGSQFVINSDINPDPEVQEIDPVIQARIDDLVHKISTGESIAFDVTYQYVDRFPLADPTFTKFGVHFTDVTGVFYQSEQLGFLNVAAATQPTTVTIEIPLNLFTAPDGKTLQGDGFVEGTPFFRIGISTNTDGAQVYQIDNFRVIALASETLPGDYNNDGRVDAADYVVWRKTLNTPETYQVWRENFGTTAGGGAGSLAVASAVPEPGACLLILLAVGCTYGARYRHP